MPTTVDLPEELLDLAKSLARGRKQMLSHVIVDLIRQGINPPAPPQISISPVSGLPVLHTGGPTLREDDISYADVQLTGMVGHKQVTDAYLAQLARARGGRLATLDRPLAALHSDVAELVPTS